MASATSEPASATTQQPGAFGSTYDVKNHYVTKVTTLGNGGVMTETYRTDEKGNNQVKIKETQTDKDGNVTKDEILSTATTGEKKALNDPDSQLNTAIEEGIDDAADSDAIKNNVDGVDPETLTKSANDAENDLSLIHI